MGALITLLFHVNLDGIIGAVISVFILKAGLEMLLDSMSDIMGRRPDAAITRDIRDTVNAIPGVLEAVVSGDGESREISAEVYASVSEETVRRAVGELNLRLPVYKRIGTVTTRSDPFPRTASGKIKYS